MDSIAPFGSMFGDWSGPCLNSVWMNKMGKAGCQREHCFQILEFTPHEKDISYLSE